MAMGKRKTTTHKPWRPDFRDVPALPDLKLVRTFFLFNLVAGMVCLILAGLFVYQEYEISVRSDSLAEIQVGIDRDLAVDRKNVADSARFMRGMNKYMEVSSFLDSPFNEGELVVELARAQIPQGMYNSLEYVRSKASGDASGARFEVNLRGSMSASAWRSAPQFIDGFVSSLGALQMLREQGASVELLTSARDSELGFFNYVIRISLVRPAGEGAK
ncbi:MAG: hypothetical protein WC360_03335 [Opitutales bacterium]|jgi:hypothetical protein